MPEPKKQKRTFEAQAAFQGMQILPQVGSAQANRKESGPAGETEGARRARAAGPADSSLVEKLIDFIKAMD